LGLGRVTLGQVQDPILESRFREQLWGAASGSNIANNFLEQLWDATMRGIIFDKFFLEQFSEHNFGKQILITILINIWK
jgi:hypothetical protein